MGKVGECGPKGVAVGRETRGRVVLKKGHEYVMEVPGDWGQTIEMGVTSGSRGRKQERMEGVDGLSDRGLVRTTGRGKVGDDEKLL